MKAASLFLMCALFLRAGGRSGDDSDPARIVVLKRLSIYAWTFSLLANLLSLVWNKSRPPCLMSSAAFAACGKHSGEGERCSGPLPKNVRLRHRNGVHLRAGIAFTFEPECRSASHRNRVRDRPDSSQPDCDKILKVSGRPGVRANRRAIDVTFFRYV